MGSWLLYPPGGTPETLRFLSGEIPELVCNNFSDFHGRLCNNDGARNKRKRRRVFGLSPSDLQPCRRLPRPRRQLGLGVPTGSGLGFNRGLGFN